MEKKGGDEASIHRFIKMDRSIHSTSSPARFDIALTCSCPFSGAGGLMSNTLAHRGIHSFDKTPRVFLQHACWYSKKASAVKGFLL